MWTKVELKGTWCKSSIYHQYKPHPGEDKTNDELIENVRVRLINIIFD